VPLSTAKEVNCIGAEPSELHLQISKAPERAEENAIHLPSGENCGPTSPQVEEINWASGFNLLGPFISTREISLCRNPCV
jgi:hypothetical protein